MRRKMKEHPHIAENKIIVQDTRNKTQQEKDLPEKVSIKFFNENNGQKMHMVTQ